MLCFLTVRRTTSCTSVWTRSEIEAKSRPVGAFISGPLRPRAAASCAATSPATDGPGWVRSEDWGIYERSSIRVAFTARGPYCARARARAHEQGPAQGESARTRLFALARRPARVSVASRGLDEATHTAPPPRRTARARSHQLRLTRQAACYWTRRSACSLAPLAQPIARGRGPARRCRPSRGRAGPNRVGPGLAPAWAGTIVRSRE